MAKLLKGTIDGFRGNFEPRWKPSWDERFAPAKAAITRALDFVASLESEQSRIFDKPDPNVSDVGRKNQWRKVLDSKAHELRRAREAVKAMNAQTAKWRASLQPVKPDPADVSAAILRAQTRDFIRGLRHGERAAFLLDPKADPLLAAAVLEAPNALSGITDEIRQHIVTAAIERAHPGQLEAVAEAEEVTKMVGAAAEWAQMQTMRAGDFASDLAFSTWVNGTTGQHANAIDTQVARAFDGIAPVLKAA